MLFLLLKLLFFSNLKYFNYLVRVNYIQKYYQGYIHKSDLKFQMIFYYFQNKLSNYSAFVTDLYRCDANIRINILL